MTESFTASTPNAWVASLTLEETGNLLPTGVEGRRTLDEADEAAAKIRGLLA